MTPPGAQDKTRDRGKERSVVIYRGNDLFAVEAVAQEIRAAGIRCFVDGLARAGVFTGLTTLDGVTMMDVVVLELDAPRAREIADAVLSADPAGPDGSSEKTLPDSP